jgi:peptidoglycan/LPS O-acetylase OafA/YrhL
MKMNELTKTKAIKLDHLDGVRGLASLVVFTWHTVLVFYLPTISIFTSKLSAIELLNNHPWWFLVNGEFAVKVFFVHSGFVLSFAFFNSNTSIYSSMFRRYFRLTIPILASIMLSYVLLKFQLYHNIEFYKLTTNAWVGSHYNFTPDFFEAIKQGLFSTYFNYKTSTSYNTVLWTISTELFGSYAIYLFLLLFGRNKFRYILYILLLFIPQSLNMHGFLFGLVLADLYCNQFILKISKKIIITLLLLVPVLSVQRSFIWQEMAAMIVIIAVLQIDPLKRFFSLKYLRVLGSLSFAIYILHLPILMSLGCYIYLQTQNVFISVLSTTVTLFISSNYFWKFIDLNGIKFSHYLYSRIKKAPK